MQQFFLFRGVIVLQILLTTLTPTLYLKRCYVHVNTYDTSKEKNTLTFHKSVYKCLATSSL